MAHVTSEITDFEGNVSKWKAAQRIALGETQADAARHADVHLDTIGRWKRSRDTEFLQYLIEALDALEDEGLRILRRKATARALETSLRDLNDESPRVRSAAARNILDYDARLRVKRLELTGEGGGPIESDVGQAILALRDARPPTSTPRPRMDVRDTDEELERYEQLAELMDEKEAIET